jgi:hypothetical protein
MPAASTLKKPQVNISWRSEQQLSCPENGRKCALFTAHFCVVFNTQASKKT